VPQLFSLGCFDAMNTQKVKIRWLFISVAAVVLLVGLVYAIADRSISTFVVSLVLAGSVILALILFPVIFILLHDFGCKVFGAIFVRHKPRQK
jgi:hypothetical protein